MSSPFDPGSPNPTQVAAPFAPAKVVPAVGRSAIAFQPAANLVYSTVAAGGAPSPAATGQTITLVDASSFPSPGAPGVIPYSVVVWPAAAQPTRANEEIVTVTAVDYGTQTLTLVRAAEGSTPRTIIDGDQVAMAITQRTATDIENAWYALDSRLDALERSLAAPWLIDIDMLQTPVASVGTWSAVTSANLLYNGTQQNQSQSQGDEINYDIAVSAGTWTFEFLYATFSVGAIATVTFGTIPVGTFDTYSAANAYNIRTIIRGIVVPTTGIYRLKFVAASRNASSAGWVLELMHTQLRRTA